MSWAVLAIVVIAGAATGGEENGSSSQPAVTTQTQAPTAEPTTPAASPTTPAASPTTPATVSCTQPCADSSGWIAELSDVKFGASSGNEFITPETGNVFVTVQVMFVNKSGSKKTAAPYNFKLTSAGVEHDAEIIGPCEAWSSVEVSPGASYGPKCLAFQAKAGQKTGLVVKWRPGLVSTYNIPVS